MDLAPTAEGFFGGFELLLAARADERAEGRRELELPAEGSLLDSHPPPAERVSAMEDLPDRPVPLPDDERPASVLISGFAALAAATAEVTFMFGYRERLEWDDFVARVFARGRPMGRRCPLRGCRATFRETGGEPGNDRGPVGSRPCEKSDHRRRIEAAFR